MATVHDVLMHEGPGSGDARGARTGLGVLDAPPVSDRGHRTGIPHRGTAPGRETGQQRAV